MSKLLLIDGNSIMNRAFYGIMGSKMLTTKDGKYTNAVYGFLAIMFKIMDDLNPDYMAVSFDLKGPTARHKMYSEYKANRHGMPNELAEQMPMIKEILQAMNIDIVEKEGYEGDDVLGTLAKYGEEKGLEVTILSGDRDTFQLASNKTTIRIPRTKAGKTETEDYDKNKVVEEYGLEPKKLIEVKGLQGDTSDNIPGVPGIGPKTAISLIKQFGSIEELYEAIDNQTDGLKGKQKENIVNNREMAFISRDLGRIDVNVPIEDTLDNLKVEEWDKQKVLEIFQELNFKRYIERFSLTGQTVVEDKKELNDLFLIDDKISIKECLEKVKKLGKIIFYFGLEDTQKQYQIIKSDISSICIYNYEENQVYYINKKGQEEQFINMIKDIFEDEKIEKYGYEINNIYIILKQMGITIKNIKYDVTVGAYILNPSDGKYPIDGLCEEYLEINVDDYLSSNGVEEKTEQMTLFDNSTSKNEIDINKFKQAFYSYSIWKISEIITSKLIEIDANKLFEEIDMPTIEVLCDKQWNGMHVEETELEEFGKLLKDGIDLLTQEIYNIAGEEFNINSTKQLGEILF